MIIKDGRGVKIFNKFMQIFIQIIDIQNVVNRCVLVLQLMFYF
jgi:hypothetical protein